MAVCERECSAVETFVHNSEVVIPLFAAVLTFRDSRVGERRGPEFVKRSRQQLSMHYTCVVEWWCWV